MNHAFIIKPIGGNCNLSCPYCYFKQKQVHGNGRMGDNILEETLNCICSELDIVEIVWHGGEPLLANIEFYKKVIEIESRLSSKNKKIFNSIQTNATLVNKDWINFLSKNNFSVGSSLDGPKNLHNLTRGSFKGTLNGIRMLNNSNILSGIICCVSSKNVKFPKEIFRFLVSEGIKNIKFLQVQGRTRNGNLSPYSVEPDAYANFLISIFNEWIELDNCNIKIRELESIISTMLGGDFRECMFAGKCFEYFTIYPDGSVYGCDSLPKVEEMRFGHVKDGISKIEKSENFVRFKERIEEIKKQCHNCEWFNICQGGCLQDWWPNIFDDRTSNIFCVALKRIYSSIYSSLKKYGMV